MAHTNAKNEIRMQICCDVQMQDRRQIGKELWREIEQSSTSRGHLPSFVFIDFHLKRVSITLGMAEFSAAATAAFRIWSRCHAYLLWAILGQCVFALHCVELIKANDSDLESFSLIWKWNLRLITYSELVLFFPVSLQTRRLDCDNHTSTAMDHRSETVESAQQLRAMGLPQEANERAETVQHLEQMCVAI